MGNGLHSSLREQELYTEQTMRAASGPPPPVRAATPVADAAGAQPAANVQGVGPSGFSVGGAAAAQATGTGDGGFLLANMFPTSLADAYSAKGRAGAAPGAHTPMTGLMHCASSFGCFMRGVHWLPSFSSNDWP